MSDVLLRVGPSPENRQELVLADRIVHLGRGTVRLRAVQDVHGRVRATLNVWSGREGSGQTVELEIHVHQLLEIATAFELVGLRAGASR